MAILDNLVFRLKAAAGQSAPHDEVSNADMTTAGTVTLVDRGAGDYAWQFEGGTGTAADTTKTLAAAMAPGAVTGDGVTIAVTLKVTTAPSVDFTRYCALRQAGSDTQTLAFTQNGAGALRARFIPSSNTTTNLVGTINATEYTHVFRVKTTSASNVTSDTWKTTTGRVGVAPETTASAAIGGASGLIQAMIRSHNGDVIQIRDFCIWNRELTDSECASVADALRTTLDTVPSVTAAVAITEQSETVSAVVTQAVTGNVAVTEQAETVAMAVSVAGSSSASIAITEQAETVATSITNTSPTTVAVGVTEQAETVAVAGGPVSGTITTGPFGNNTVAGLLPNLTGLTVSVQRLADLVQVAVIGSETTGSDARMTVSSPFIVPGVEYVLTVKDAAGTIGAEKYTAA